MAPYTVETFFDNRIKIRQFSKGYRFSMDPLVLAAHIRPFPNSRILDAGCGCGIISLLLAWQYQVIQVFGVDIQQDFVSIARENAQINGLEDRFQVLDRDLANLFPEDLGGKMDLVVSNPPYIKRGSGRICPNEQSALARHEITMDINLLCEKAADLTGDYGSLVVIFPTDRLVELKKGMILAGFVPERIRFVYTGKDRISKLVMVSAGKRKNQNVQTLPSFYIFDEQGHHCPEYNEVMSHGRARYLLYGQETLS